MRRGNEEVCVLEIVRPGMEDSESAKKQENTGIGPASVMMLVRGSRECGRSYCALAPCGRGQLDVAASDDGLGVCCRSNPSPIRVRGQTIVPSPARGEGTRGERRAFWPNEANDHFAICRPRESGDP